MSDSDRHRILISVKTYPALSRREAAEMVCTAGFLEKTGKWVRIYPMPFRALEKDQKYQKWEWVEAELEKNTLDNRPESYSVKNPASMKPLGDIVPTDNFWRERMKHVERAGVHEDLRKIIGMAHDNELSLAAFRPAKILEFKVEETDRNWNPDRVRILEQKAKQLHFFDSPEEVKRQFEKSRKLPYKFSYRFVDIKGKESTLMIEDWEIGALYWNCLKESNGDEMEAIKKVRKKYALEFLSEHDILLFLGTTQEHHNKKAPNPFVIIGVFYPKKPPRAPLLDSGGG